MGIDAIAKRFFPAIVCALLFLGAYFQARGVAALVAAEIPPPPSTARRTVRPPSPLFQPNERVASAQPILARNAFDSVTGPLDQPKMPEAPTPVAASTSPTEDPICATGSVVLIADSEDPQWSFAVIKGSGNTAKMRRIGDDVDGQTLKGIAWDRVWLMQGSSRCQLQMLSKKPEGGDRSKPQPAIPERKPSGEKEPETTDLAGDVHKISDTEFVIARSAADKIPALQKDLMKNARLVPNKGIRLSRAPASSPLGQLGFATGDIIKTINGFDMNDPDKALEGYSRLKTASDVTVGLERGGAPVTISIKIQ